MASSRAGAGPFVEDPALLRTVVLVGHSGAGKTTLAEAVLAATGALNRAGRVEDGTACCDTEDVEKELGRSVSLAAASCLVTRPSAPGGGGPVKLTLVDTPGHPDFVGELRAGLRAADAALFVVSAADGVDGGTRLLWEECAAVGMPRAVVVTHVDSPRGDFSTAVAICQRVFGEGVQPLYLPLLGDDDVPRGLLAVLTQRVLDASSGTVQARTADPEHLEAVAEQHQALVEGIIQESEDDELLDRWLAGEEVPEDVLVGDLERAVARGSFHPVLPVVPTTGLGVPELLEVLVRCFPSPLEHPLPPVTTPDGDPREAVTCDPSGPLVAEVVKTTTDPYVGRVSLVRVFSGTLEPDAAVHVSGHQSSFAAAHADGRGVPHPEWHADHDVDERVGAVSAPLGAALAPLPRGVAGDVVAVARLTRAETGDTLSSPTDPALLEPWVLPEPLLPVALTAGSSTEEDRLAQGLQRLVAEDPTLRVEVDPGTGQLVVWTMGEAHRDVLLHRLRSRAGVEARAEPVRVALRETLAGPGTGHGRHVKQSGGHGQYAVVDIEAEPLPEGTGFEFVDRVVGGAVPRQFVPSVEKGLRAAMASGVVSGNPMVDVRVTLVGGKAHSVDSSDAAFQVAARLALEDAARTAGVRLLEPVDDVRVVVDDAYLGAVLGDLAVRRGRVLGTDAVEGGRTEVRAEVPASELTRYAAELRSLAHGTGSFTRAPMRHAPVPDAVARQLVST